MEILLEGRAAGPGDMPGENLRDELTVASDEIMKTQWKTNENPESWLENDLEVVNCILYLCSFSGNPCVNSASAC